MNRKQLLLSWNSEPSWDKDEQVILVEYGDYICSIRAVYMYHKNLKDEHITCCRIYVEGGQDKERILEREDEGDILAGSRKSRS